MAKKQQYGIKYPFTVNNDNGYFVDVNLTTKEKIRSLIMHVIFTPKGQKIRDPEFGTDLIKYIFEPSDDFSWELVKNEAIDAIKKYVNGVIINDINILQDEDDLHQIYVRIDYSFNDGLKIINDSVATKI